MAGVWYEYSELLLRDNLKLRTDKDTLQRELDVCRKSLDRNRGKNNEDSYIFKSRYEDEVRRNEVLRQELQELVNGKYDLERQVDILKQKLKRREETIECYKKELCKNIHEKEHQISDLEELLKHTVNILKKTETRFCQAKNDKDIQLQSLKQSEHYLEKQVTRLNLKITYLKHDCERITREKNSAEWSKQHLLQDLKEKDNQLRDTKFERDLEEHTRRNLERLAELDKKKISSLTNKLERLGGEFRCKNLKLQQLEYLQQCENNQIHENINVTKALKEKDDRISELTTQVVEALSALKETKASYDNKQDEVRIHLLARKNLETKIQGDGMRIKEFEEDLKVKAKESHELDFQLQRALTKQKITEERLNELKDMNWKATNDNAGMKDQEDTNEQVICPLERKIQRLEREIGQRDGKLDAGESRNMKVTNEIEQLICELKKKEDLFSEQSNHLKQAVTKLKETEDKLHKTTSERDNERHSRENLERKATENHTRIQELKQVNDKLALSYKQKIDNLESEIERRDLKLKRMEDILGKSKTEDKNERRMINDLKEKEEKIFEQSHQLQQILKTLKQTEAKLQETITERDIERQRRQEHEGKAKVDQTRTKAMEHIKDEVVTPQKQRIQSLERELKRRDMNVKDLEDTLEKTKAEVGNGKKLGHDLSKREDQLAELEQQMKNVLVKLRQTETELEETKTRLSKAMGDRLTDNNPNIADLSDKNRPVKLAERYAELYDNQWTDAFDILGTYFDGEQNTIEALLEILQDVMNFCLASGSKQMKDLENALGFSKANARDVDVPTDVRKHLKDCRKAMSSIAMKNLYEMYISHLKPTAPQTLGRAMEVRTYVQECLEICWLMVIQDPPVVFVPVAKSGSALNTDLYKPYTRSGTHVEFTVWPALLLHEGGPVLAKGVAQGYGKKSNNANQ